MGCLTVVLPAYVSSWTLFPWWINPRDTALLSDLSRTQINPRHGHAVPVWSGEGACAVCWLASRVRRVFFTLVGDEAPLAHREVSHGMKCVAFPCLRVRLLFASSSCSGAYASRCFVSCRTYHRTLFFCVCLYNSVVMRREKIKRGETKHAEPKPDRSFPVPMSELKAESERPLFASRDRKEASGDASAQPAANVGTAVL